LKIDFDSGLFFVITSKNYALFLFCELEKLKFQLVLAKKYAYYFSSEIVGSIEMNANFGIVFFEFGK
jgi:hypothetical protein